MSHSAYAAIALRPRHVQRARSKHVSLGIERIRCRLHVNSGPGA